MTAYEAQQKAIANKSLNKKLRLSDILMKINHAAEIGQCSVSIPGNISDYLLSKLMDLGYTFYKQYDYGRSVISILLKWEYVVVRQLESPSVPL